jgi:hypothetical protein
MDLDTGQRKTERRKMELLSTEEHVHIDHFDYQLINEFPKIIEEDIEKDVDIMNRNLNLTKLEYYRLCLFKENHSDCGKGMRHGTIGVGYKLTFAYNAIGRSVTVECPFCGHSADITDYSAW